MFCPRCGQQPASTAIRFCAHCGLRLEGVSHLLMNDGLLPHQIAVTPTEPTLKQRERRRGAKILFSSFISFPLFAALCALTNNPVPLIVPLTLFIAGVCWMLYAKFFCEDTPLPQKLAPMKSTPPLVYSPPVQNQPIIPPVRTTEIEPPHSVIEHTTRQLGRERQPQ